MRSRFSVALGIAAAALLLAAAPAMSQDLAGPTPCCGKVCEGTTSTACGPLLSQAGLSTLAGCLGADDLLCVGGQVGEDGNLVDGCLCIGGSCSGPVGSGNGPFTDDACTAAAVDACTPQNVVTTPNDPDCCPEGTTLCDGECVDLQTDESNCGACGVACAPGQQCVDGECTGGGGPGNSECEGTVQHGGGQNSCNLHGLCTAYFAGSEKGKEHKHQAPPFQALQDAACSGEPMECGEGQCSCFNGNCEDIGQCVADFCPDTNPGGHGRNPSDGSPGQSKKK